MKYPKGTIFESNGELYRVVDRLNIVNGSYVLAYQDDENDEVLFTEDEIEEGLEEGWLTIKK
ncbi:hypothetical protein [Sporomusa termitida]|uniref:Uncharacterized protein n=1 Tax=Sporomusa termitida TaxID=2377 RepID=A0A517DVJ5_9FIRM|nr:hypothetical protein [Sporomusa termitida]QDR81358.1 hypothetical protein SPTER_27370 [Sporomusa termitida]